jgi:hypothetical protein
LDGARGRGDANIPFIFQAIPQLENLDLYISLAVMLQNLLVGLPLSMLQVVEVGGVRFSLVAGPQMCKVALHISGCTGAAGGRQSDV